MELNNWFKALTGSASIREAADKVGTSKSTLSRQLDRGTLSPEMVIALCRAYGKSPITGLVENGYLNDYETEGAGIPFALKKATNIQILHELTRRSDPEARILFHGDGREDVIDLEDYESPTDYVGGVRYAADKREPEPSEGDDDYGSGA